MVFDLIVGLAARAPAVVSLEELLQLVQGILCDGLGAFQGSEEDRTGARRMRRSTVLEPAAAKVFFGSPARCVQGEEIEFDILHF